MKIRHIAAALAVTTAATIAVSAPAIAATKPQPGVVVAQDRTAMISAEPTAPGEITVTTAPDTRVSLVPTQRSATKGTRPVNHMSDNDGRAVFRGLTPGTSYTVLTIDAGTTVTALGGAGSATGLTVTTIDAPESVALTWNHRAHKPGRTSFRITATPQPGTLPTIVDEVTATSAVLSGLDPTVRYTFTVTPTNALGAGTATSARMNRTLADITGRSALVDTTESNPAPVTAPVTAPAPTPTATPQPGPSSSPEPAAATPPAPQPAAPRTRTIYVCPDGFTESGNSCTKSSPYTYSTREYTYTYGKTGTETYTDTCSSGYTDENGQFHWVEQPHPCTRTRDVFGNIKDATPAGWSDTGSNWSKKDGAPAGWSDTGSQYVQTADKVAKEVPA